MAKILLNMSSQPAGAPAGVARFAMELSRRLIARGTHDYLFRSQWSADQLPKEIAGAKIEVIPPITNYLKEFMVAAFKAGSAYPASKYDLVVNLDALGLASGGRNRLTIIHDIYYRSMPQMYSKFHRMKSHFIHSMIIGRSRVVVGISDATSNEVKKAFPSQARKVRTILSDSTMDAVVPGTLPEGLTPGGYVLAVANVTPNKNFGVLAEAFGRMASDHPGLRLVHVGGDGDETFARGLEPFGAGDRLTRLRGIDDATLAALYRDAACLVVPSLFEGFCLPILEAQRFDCPVIFSKTSATGEVGGRGGITFDPTDASELETALRDVVGHADAQDNMRAVGRENALRFSWERTVDLYEEAILAAISKEK